MGCLQRSKSRVWKFITWTPADVLYRTDPLSSSACAVFHSKILRSSLKALFVNIIVLGVLLDILFLIDHVLQPYETSSEPPPTRNLFQFILLSGLNFTYHLVFLLLRKKKSVAKYQSVISAISLGILYYIIKEYQVLLHDQPSVPLWTAIGLLQTLVAVYYCQGSFVCSMFVWIVSSVWVSSGDSVNIDQRVCQRTIDDDNY